MGDSGGAHSGGGHGAEHHGSSGSPSSSSGSTAHHDTAASSDAAHHTGDASGTAGGATVTSGTASMEAPIVRFLKDTAGHAFPETRYAFVRRLSPLGNVYLVVGDAAGNIQELHQANGSHWERVSGSLHLATGEGYAIAWASRAITTHASSTTGSTTVANYTGVSPESATSSMDSSRRTQPAAHDLQDHILRVPDDNELTSSVGAHFTFSLPHDPIELWPRHGSGASSTAPAAPPASPNGYISLHKVELQFHFSGTVGSGADVEVEADGHDLSEHAQYSIARGSFGPLGGTSANPWELSEVHGLSGHPGQISNLNLGWQLSAPEIHPFGEQSLTIAVSATFNLVSYEHGDEAGFQPTDVQFGLIEVEVELSHLCTAVHQVWLAMNGSLDDALLAPHVSPEGAAALAIDGTLSATVTAQFLPNWPAIFRAIGRQWTEAGELVAELTGDGAMGTAFAASLTIVLGAAVVWGIIVIGEHMLNDMDQFQQFCREMARQLFLYCYGYSMGRMGNSVRSAGAGSEQAVTGCDRAQQDMHAFISAHPDKTMAMCSLQARQHDGRADAANAFRDRYIEVFNSVLPEFRRRVQEYATAHGEATGFHTDLADSAFAHVAAPNSQFVTTLGDHLAGGSADSQYHTDYATLLHSADLNIGTAVTDQSLTQTVRGQLVGRSSGTGSGTSGATGASPGLTDAQRQTLLNRPVFTATGSAPGHSTSSGSASSHSTPSSSATSHSTPSRTTPHRH
jgi:hypothetical protein